jgi:hypothetical protein
VLKAVDAAGKTHTLLYGYLPLGGFHYHRDPAQALDLDSQQAVATAVQESLPWPFGFRKPLDQSWQPAYSRPIDHGRPSKAMFELLRVLTNRYHLGEQNVDENAALERHAAQLTLYDVDHLPAALRAELHDDGTRGAFLPHARGTLLAYLRACFDRGPDNPLVRWIVLQEKRIDAAGSLAALSQLEQLPNSAGTGTIELSLLITQSDAQEIRALLGQRLREQTLAKVREIPLPKFTQGAGDLYQIAIFVRSLNDEGKEQIQWADARARSIPFRVAAPFDPEASRPALIQMPTLADLKRGLAKGVSILTPGDTFDLMNSLKLGKGATPDAVPDEEPGPGLGLQWICSFSLPVITLVAMILLMIMVVMLNLVFFWLPFVRICLPFPKMK